MALVEWSTRFSQKVQVLSVADDSDMNVYSTGPYNLDLELYDAITHSNQTFGMPDILTGNAFPSSFIAKHDRDGKLVWGVRISSDTGVVVSAEIIVDVDQVYVVGQYNGDLRKTL